MPAGLEVRNVGNIIQITDQFSNYALISKGVGEFVPSYPYMSRCEIIVPKQGAAMPILAIRSGVLCFLQAVVDRGTYWLLEVNGNANEQTIGMQFEWYAFGIPPTQSNSKFGLQVFRADTVLAFDSSFNYMKIVDYIQSPANILPLFRNLPSGRKYAVCTIYPSYEFRINPGGGGFNWGLDGAATMHGVTTDGYRIDNGLFYMEDLGPNPPTSTPGPGRQNMAYMVVDVTYF